MAAKCECDRCRAIVDPGDWLRVGRLGLSVEEGRRPIDLGEDYFDLCRGCAADAFGDLGAIDMPRGCGYERPIADRALARICETAAGGRASECSRCGDPFATGGRTVVSYPAVTIGGVRCEGLGRAYLCLRCTDERVTGSPERVLARLCGIEPQGTGKPAGDPVFAITTLGVPDDDWGSVASAAEVPRRRTVGFFRSRPEAESMLTGDFGDLGEAGYYQLAVVEEIPPGLYPVARGAKWYRYGVAWEGTTRPVWAEAEAPAWAERLTGCAEIG